MGNEAVKLSITDCEALHSEASDQLQNDGEISFKGTRAEVLLDILGVFIRILGFLDRSGSFGRNVRKLFSLVNRKSNNSKKK